MYISVLSECIDVYHVYAHCPQKSGEVIIRFSETGVADTCEFP